MVGPADKREAVAHLCGMLEVSERRACRIVAADRKMIRYRFRRLPDTELRTRLRELANQRRRFGYRRLFILLRAEGEPSGVNRIYRLYREEGLAVRKRRSRRKAIGTRAPILVEAKPNARWSLDFVHDQLGCGRRFRILNIADDVTRECLAAIPDYLVPTLVTYDQVAQFGKSHKFPEASLQKLQEVLDKGACAIEKAIRAGVNVGFGTDLLGETHPAQSEEFTLRAQVQPNADVLRSATVVNADLLQHSGKLGILKPGAFADFLLVSGDPLKDLTVLGGQGEHLDVIVRGGVIFKNALH